MRPLIDSTIIDQVVTVSEENLKTALIEQVMSDLGLIRDGGKYAPGTTAKCLRGEGGKGGYRVIITRDMSKDTTPRIAKE